MYIYIYIISVVQKRYHLCYQCNMLFLVHIGFSSHRRIPKLQLQKKFIQIMPKYFMKTIQPIEKHGYNTSRFSEDDSFQNASEENTRQNSR